MSDDDGFRPLADPRYFDDDPVDDDVYGDPSDAAGWQDRAHHHRGRQGLPGRRGSPSVWPPAPEPPTPSPPGFLRVAGGLLLIALGLEFLVEHLVGVTFEITPLVIGVLLLSWWARRGQRWAYVAGAIVTGIGVGAFLDGIVPGPVGGLLSSLATAGGFAVLAVRPPHLRWAWWPAAIIGVTGVAGFGISLAAALFSAGASTVVLPASLMVAGAVLLARGSLRPGVRKLVLLSCAAVFVLAASARASETVTPIGAWFGGATEVFPLDTLPGETLRIDAGRHDLTVESGRQAELHARSVSGIDVARLKEATEVALDRDATVVVPVGVSLIITTSGGGDVELRQLVWGELSSLSITTERGDVAGTIVGNPTIEVETDSGGVEIDETDYPDGYDGALGEGEPRVRVTTKSGDIDLARTRTG